MAPKLRLFACGIGCALVLFAGCSDDERAKPSFSAGGKSNTAGSGNKAGQAGKSNAAAGDGNVATPGGAAGNDAGEGGAAPTSGSPGVDGPPSVGGDPGLMLEPCPSDDAPAPAGFSGVCSTAQAWANGADALELGAGRAPSFVAITPDELTVVWSEVDSSLHTYLLADRATSSEVFGEAQELTLTGVVGLSPDGLRVTLANTGRLAEAVREERGQSFGEAEPGAYAALNADADAKQLSLDDAVISPDEKTLYYTAWSSEKYSTYPLLVSTRTGGEAWPVGVALQSCELKAYGARGPRPTAISSDGLTLFFHDAARATARAAFRSSSSGVFSWFTDLPGRLGAQPNAACDTLYYSPISDALRVLAAARKP
ncbi:MAG TPA: hypothetical protein VHP33_32960 [Polyangiaceae bacterium]|nr:hypothetical protein [Polyangiaceae bacterium]